MDWDAKGLFLFSNPMEFISIYYIKHILAIHSDAWQAQGHGRCMACITYILYMYIHMLFSICYEKTTKSSSTYQVHCSNPFRCDVT